VLSFKPLPLCLRGTCPRYLFSLRLGGSQSRLDWFGGEKNFLSLPETEPLSLGYVTALHGSRMSSQYRTHCQWWILQYVWVSKGGPGGHAIAQLVEALRYRPEGRGFKIIMMSLEFFIDIIFPTALWLWGRLSFLTEMSTRNISWG
jgi:hypothetical protein